MNGGMEVLGGCVKGEVSDGERCGGSTGEVFDGELGCGGSIGEVLNGELGCGGSIGEGLDGVAIGVGGGFGLGLGGGRGGEVLGGLGSKIGNGFGDGVDLVGDGVGFTRLGAGAGVET